MKNIKLLFIFLAFFDCSSYGQSNTIEYSLYINQSNIGIKKNVQLASQDSIIHEIIYLGEIKNSSDLKFHVLRDFQLIPTANGKKGRSFLIFFSSKEKFTYEFDLPEQLPVKITNEQILFIVKGEKKAWNVPPFNTWLCTPLGCFERVD
jgi:hypothetical protein